MSVNPQALRVLKALEKAGPRGLTRVDFGLPNVVDGGPPIVNIPARILELKQAGHPVGENGRRDRCRVYVLEPMVVSAPAQPSPHIPRRPGQTGLPSDPVSDPAGADTTTGQLFHLPVREPSWDELVPPIYGDDAA